MIPRPGIYSMSETPRQPDPPHAPAAEAEAPDACANDQDSTAAGDPAEFRNPQSAIRNPQSPRLHRIKCWFRSAAAIVGVCLAGLAGSAFMCYGYGGATYRWRGMDVQVRLVPSLRGETRLVFAPLGEVRA